MKMLALFLRTRLRRVLALVGFALVFLASGITARVLVGAEAGHVEIGQLFLVGGYPLVSALLLLGWLLGRYPLIAALVLTAGLVSSDRTRGFMRLYAARPISLPAFYAARYAAIFVIAVVLSSVLLPLFDILLLGSWAGPMTIILIVSYVAVYGALTFLLSVWTHVEGWIAVALAMVAMIWDALSRSGKLSQAPPGVREVITIVLPPQGALFQIEGAFGAAQSIPWGPFLYACSYSVILVLAALVSLRLREF